MIRLILFAFVLFIPAGCSQAQRTRSDSDADLSIPDLPPKPLIWASDDQPKEIELTERQRDAKEAADLADRFKATEQYAKAERGYLAASAFDPSFSYAVYQLACNYELWGKHEQAVEKFEQAIKLGFSDFPTALADNELGDIRKRPQFKQELVDMRKRYIESASKKVGQSLALKAQGTKPAKGWPVIIMLHGYGDTNRSYLDLAKAWSDAGFAAIALPGTIPSGDKRYIWSLDSIQPTRTAIKSALDSPLLKDIDRDQIFLLGFSQGALHAMLIATQHPGDFAGVVGLSPGGSLSEKLYTPKLAASGESLKCYFIHGDQEPHGPLVERWSKAFNKVGWDFASSTHPGGHHFPRDWKTKRQQVIKFLRE